MSEAKLGKKEQAVGQSPDQARPEEGFPVAWIGAWTAVLSIALWLSQLSPIWLAPLVAGSAIWTFGAVRARQVQGAVGAVLLWAAVGVAAGVEYRLHQLATNWDGLLLEIEDSSAAALGDALDDLLSDGEHAVTVAAEAAEQLPAGPPLFALIDALQRSTGVSAIALFDASGSAVVWAGEHRGPVPVPVREGTRSYAFYEGPLFSYLYFVRPLSGGVTAAAAFLLESNVDVEDELQPFALEFEQRHGTLPRFWSPERARGDAVWDWATDEGSIMSVSFAELTEQHWWERIVESGRQGAGILGLLVLLALSLAWYRTPGGHAGVPVLVGTTALLLAPLDRILGAEMLFSPLRYVLPGPLDISLGVLLILLGGSALWILTVTGGEARRRIPLGLAVLVAALVFPLVVIGTERAAADSLLTTRPAGGVALQLVTALAMAIPLYLLLRHTRPGGSRRRLVRIVGYLLPAVLAVFILAWWTPARPFSLWLGALWAIPASLLLAFPAESPKLGASLRFWLLSGWLAGTATLAFLWPLHLEAELGRAERDVALLGSRPDPFLDFLLRQFAQGAQTLAAEGEAGVNLLYQSWVDSGLAREGYEARLTSWEDGEVASELNLSQIDSIPAPVRELAASQPSEPVVLHYGGSEGLHYLLSAPLPGDRTITAAVPPRRRLGAPKPLAGILHPGQGEAIAADDALYLVPVDAGTLAADHVPLPRADTVQWVRTERGWRSEALVEMPEGLMHAHLEVRTPEMPLLLTRAALLQAGILFAMALLWFVGRAICRDLRSSPAIVGSWLRSFRGRVSVSLFVFFLLPTIVFGAFSYSAVAREVVRSATALAQQALDQAAARIDRGSLAQMGDAVQTDLLLYRGGTLASATAPEVIDLGLFPTWLPPSVYLRLAGGDDMERLEERRLARSEYLVAYRRLDAASVLAAPIPLASNEITRRQQEFRDVALLVTLLGLGLSIVLALFVGRALSRPLDELSRAALTVGAGNLRTRLPETRSDEFGSVYAAFNRMVERLHRTRAALVQETRRTETIVAEAATGVLALDRDGRLELINPRAAEILGMRFEPGDPLLRTDDDATPLSAALAELWRTRTAEAGAEIEIDGRIIRLKLRRLQGEDGGGGAVVALEDMTAEVRTARVLAWGEMARQVAHEIKNPLTPIKLAVQHVRRAYLDQRPDFGAILDRNVEAILREIDRLGEIARAFSRFGTPAAGAGDLEDVDLDRALAETAALYAGSGEEAGFRLERPTTPLPRVVARPGELKEVLLNLLENARDAVTEGGEIVLSAGRAARPEWVFVAVEDSGTGIPADQLPRIFEPHFSTRSSGTGLGLAIVRRLVDSWGAEIRAESNPGEGTRIEILLRSAASAHLHTGT
ncbi:MAG TPA: ATP-binding protein [Longimicrobiaceae bacterium]|nr:ATP-binding protein [Longimicrobiaceae bacterium]